MGALKALLDDLAEQRTFRFEEPWRLSSKALGLAIPILRTRYGDRAYVVLDEIAGGIDIRDSGEIRRLIVKSGVDKPVFVRGGILVKGETQPRATRFSVVVLPGEERPIEALCVHDVRPIRARARMELARDAPAKLMASIMEGDQAEVWHDIAARAAIMPRAAAPSIVHRLTTTTNLIEVERALEEADRKIRDVVERFPLIKDQVGVIVIDAKGVFAMELFDHPDSWSAVARNAGRKFAEVLAEECDFEIFKPDKEGTMEAIGAFIGKLAACEEKEVFKNELARTAILRGDGVCGEHTVLEGSVIHLMAVREERLRPYVRVAEPLFRIEPAREASLAGTTRFLGVVETWRPRAARTAETLRVVLKALEGGGKAWSELENGLAGEMSTATLSKRLKNGLRHGLLARTLREDGRVTYELTAKGKALLEWMREGKE